MGRRIVDARFLFLGLLSNLGVIASLFALESGWSASNIQILILLTLEVLASAVLTAFGFLKTSFLSADAAGLMIFGNFPVWVFGSMNLIWSNVGYQEEFSRCQEYSVGATSALYNCEQARYDQYLIWLFAVSLTIAAVATFASLLRLRKLSKLS